MALNLRWKPVNKVVTVTTGGTAVQVSTTSISTPSIVFQSASSNTGRVFVGDSAVTATPASSQSGALLNSAGDAISFSGDDGGMGAIRMLDASDFYVDAAVNGEKVLVTYFVQG